MSQQILQYLRKRPAFRTAMFFVTVLCIAVVLIMLGRRADAVTEARRFKGGILTADEVACAFEGVGGKLLSRKVSEGDRVKKGQLLMVIDDRDLQNTVADLRASLAQLDAEIRKQELDLKNARDRVRTTEISQWRQIESLESKLRGSSEELSQAKAEYKRYSSLVEVSAASRSAYDKARAVSAQAEAQHTAALKSLEELTVGATARQMKRLHDTGSAEGMTLSAITQMRTDCDSMEQALHALEASRDAAQARLDQQLLNLSRTKLYAPCDGIVLDTYFEEGELVPASAAALNLETERRYYDVYLSERTVARYKKGSAVTGTAPALGREVKGIARSVNAAPSFADLRMTREQGQADLTSFRLRVDVTDAPEELRTGMTVEIADESD
ncbi:MAG: biotin/lipoyl-binding protein [Succinivibrionaceae bacterium]|nr:biotin/lipoyl-binding protein [Pseudomonadota bacterium]MDY3144295.1 biotin/lipoyl-binding protein [Succinivibrionaceae bacterium]